MFNYTLTTACCSLQDIFVWFVVIYVQVSSSSFPILRTFLVLISYLDFPEDLNINSAKSVDK